MQNIINFLSFPIVWIILVVIFVVSIFFRIRYVDQTKELSVKYAKLVLKKYKSSRSNTITYLYDYLDSEILKEYPNWTDKKRIELSDRVLKHWFSNLSKTEIKNIPLYNKYLVHCKKLNNSNIYKTGIIWFPENDKNSRIYFLKKVISRNSK